MRFAASPACGSDSQSPVVLSAGLFAVADIDPTQYLEVFGELLSAGERDAREREYLQRGHLGILSSFRVQNDTHEFFIDQTRVSQSIQVRPGRIAHDRSSLHPHLTPSMRVFVLSTAI